MNPVHKPISQEQCSKKALTDWASNWEVLGCKGVRWGLGALDSNYFWNCEEDESSGRWQCSLGSPHSGASRARLCSWVTSPNSYSFWSQIRSNFPLPFPNTCLHLPWTGYFAFISSHQRWQNLPGRGTRAGEHKGMTSTHWMQSQTHSQKSRNSNFGQLWKPWTLFATGISCFCLFSIPFSCLLLTTPLFYFGESCLPQVHFMLFQRGWFSLCLQWYRCDLSPVPEVAIKSIVSHLHASAVGWGWTRGPSQTKHSWSWDYGWNF